VTLIQSNFGSPGNLELIARVGLQLHFMWRDSGPAFQWTGPFLWFPIPGAAPASNTHILVKARCRNAIEK
jgi:hypothetical protein